eukprot:TRINITY_DN3889_c0_g1_i1.p3 TRINITY_DN3889_c0_g1~~TRINITY_DN3889_c0_g1_i1.p3  ORF type:complete len:116 (+),score=3.51 TRINITY_DN3889_c0_g1_i1:507-854(+)
MFIICQKKNGMRAWQFLNSHQKFLYAINQFPDLGKKKSKRYKKWSPEIVEEDLDDYYTFDIQCRFWFLCQTYTLMKHIFDPYAEKDKYQNGMPILYARKIITQNMTISSSPWNHY